MSTSRTSFLSEILSGGVIPAGKLAYFRQRFRNKLHAMVLTEFAYLEKAGELTKAELARRIGKKPEQITRWLMAPGNWTMDTVSDLLLGMGTEPHIEASYFDAARSASVQSTAAALKSFTIPVSVFVVDPVPVRIWAGTSAGWTMFAETLHLPEGFVEPQRQEMTH
jgi:hypothetical protein